MKNKKQRRMSESVLGTCITTVSGSREEKDVLKCLKGSYFDNNEKLLLPWKPVNVKIVKNNVTENRYLKKRTELSAFALARGLDDRNLSEELFAFHVVTDVNNLSLLQQILDCGLCCSRKRPNKKHYLGNENRGIAISRYADIAIKNPNVIKSGPSFILVVFKVMLGMSKKVTIRDREHVVEPSPGYHSHVANEDPIKGGHFERNLAASMMYLYELNEDGTVEKYPRHCKPYALVTYSRVQYIPKPLGECKKMMEKTWATKRDDSDDNSDMRKNISSQNVKPTIEVRSLSQIKFEKNLTSEQTNQNRNETSVQLAVTKTDHFPKFPSKPKRFRTLSDRFGAYVGKTASSTTTVVECTGSKDNNGQVPFPQEVIPVTRCDTKKELKLKKKPVVILHDVLSHQTWKNEADYLLVQKWKMKLNSMRSDIQKKSIEMLPKIPKKKKLACDVTNVESKKFKSETKEEEASDETVNHLNEDAVKTAGENKHFGMAEKYCNYLRKQQLSNKLNTAEVNDTAHLCKDTTSHVSNLNQLTKVSISTAFGSDLGKHVKLSGKRQYRRYHPRKNTELPSGTSGRDVFNLESHIYGRIKSRLGTQTGNEYKNSAGKGAYWKNSSSFDASQNKLPVKSTLPDVKSTTKECASDYHKKKVSGFGAAFQNTDTVNRNISNENSTTANTCYTTHVKVQEHKSDMDNHEDLTSQENLFDNTAGTGSGNVDQCEFYAEHELLSSRNIIPEPKEDIDVEKSEEKTTRHVTFASDTRVFLIDDVHEKSDAQNQDSRHITIGDNLDDNSCGEEFIHYENCRRDEHNFHVKDSISVNPDEEIPASQHSQSLDELLPEKNEDFRYIIFSNPEKGNLPKTSINQLSTTGLVEEDMAFEKMSSFSREKIKTIGPLNCKAQDTISKPEPKAIQSDKVICGSMSTDHNEKPENNTKGTITGIVRPLVVEYSNKLDHEKSSSIIIKEKRKETAKKFHGRTLLKGKGVPARNIPMEQIYLKKPICKNGQKEVIPVDPRMKEKKCMLPIDLCSIHYSKNYGIADIEIFHEVISQKEKTGHCCKIETAPKNAPEEDAGNEETKSMKVIPTESGFNGNLCDPRFQSNNIHVQLDCEPSVSSEQNKGVSCDENEIGSSTKEQVTDCITCPQKPAVDELPSVLLRDSHHDTENVKHDSQTTIAEEDRLVLTSVENKDETSQKDFNNEGIYVDTNDDTELHTTDEKYSKENKEVFVESDVKEYPQEALTGNKQNSSKYSWNSLNPKDVRVKDEQMHSKLRNEDVTVAYTGDAVKTVSDQSHTYSNEANRKLKTDLDTCIGCDDLQLLDMDCTTDDTGEESNASHILVGVPLSRTDDNGLESPDIVAIRKNDLKQLLSQNKNEIQKDKPCTVNEEKPKSELKNDFLTSFIDKQLELPFKKGKKIKLTRKRKDDEIDACKTLRDTNRVIPFKFPDSLDYSDVRYSTDTITDLESFGVSDKNDKSCMNPIKISHTIDELESTKFHKTIKPTRHGNICNQKEISITVKNIAHSIASRKSRSTSQSSHSSICLRSPEYDRKSRSRSLSPRCHARSPYRTDYRESRSRSPVYRRKHQSSSYRHQSGSGHVSRSDRYRYRSRSRSRSRHSSISSNHSISTSIHSWQSRSRSRTPSYSRPYSRERSNSGYTSRSPYWSPESMDSRSRSRSPSFRSRSPSFRSFNQDTFHQNLYNTAHHSAANYNQLSTSYSQPAISAVPPFGSSFFPFTGGSGATFNSSAQCSNIVPFSNTPQSFYSTNVQLNRNFPQYNSMAYAAQPHWTSTQTPVHPVYSYPPVGPPVQSSYNYTYMYSNNNVQGNGQS